MRFGAIRPKWRASSKIGAKVFNFTMDTPSSPEKRLVRAMQHTQFRAKNAKNDLNPTNSLKRNLYFTTTKRTFYDFFKS